MKRKLKVLLVVGVIGGVGLAGSWVASRLPGRQVVVLDPLGSMSPEQVAAAELARSNGDEEVKLTVSAEKVEVLIPGESDWRAGENEMLLPVGSRVRTNEGGRAQIEYPGGTVTRLDNDSEVLLETVETGQEKFFGVRIMGGRVWSRVSRVLGKVTYETRSSNVVAAVRGTEYEHDVRGGVDTVLVAESSVDVRCVNGSGVAVVDVSEQATFDCRETKITVKGEKVEEASVSAAPRTEVVKKKVSEDKLTGSWYEYNGAREVIRRPKKTAPSEQEQKEQSGETKSRIAGATSGEASGAGEPVGDRDKRVEVAKKTSKVNTLVDKLKSLSRRKTSKKDLGRVRVQCTDNCDKLVVEGEAKMEGEVRVELVNAKDENKVIDLGVVAEGQRELVSESVVKESVCNPGEYQLRVVYPDGSGVNYETFSASDLGCN